MIDINTVPAEYRQLMAEMENARAILNKLVAAAARSGLRVTVRREMPLELEVYLPGRPLPIRLLEEWMR